MSLLLSLLCLLSACRVIGSCVIVKFLENLFLVIFLIILVLSFRSE
jgi:hypothetical protein